MALLADTQLNGQGGQISQDLLDAMARVQSEMGGASEEDAVFDLTRSRRNIALRAKLAARDLVLPPVATSEQQIATAAGEIMLRTYSPASTGPVIVFVHGGGWIGGSPDTHDAMSRWFSLEAGAMVVVPDYSLAPENPFPKATIEVAGAIASVLQHIEAGRRLFVMGDSAGANIAAMAVLRLSAAQRAAIAGFISIYGAFAPDMALSSHRLYGDGRFGLSEARMRWCWTLYAPQLFPGGLEEMTPLGKDLSGFPPTLCIGAECDVLLDDSMAFYSQLAAATVDVSLSLWPALPHGCLHYVGVVNSVTSAARSIVRHISTSRASPRAVVAVPADDAAFRGAEDAILRDVDQFFHAPKSKVHGSITHALAMDIVRGKIAPGQALPTEANASAAMNSSRSAYREAMRTLSAKGLLISAPKVGTKIAPRDHWNILDPDVLAWHFEAEPNDHFIRDLFELRKTVGPSAAAMAAGRSDDADLAALTSATKRIASSGPYTQERLTATADYHRAVLFGAKNRALIGLWPSVNATLRWSMKLQLMLPMHRLAHDPADEHTRLLEQIKGHNERGALTAMTDLVDIAFAEALANLALFHARSTRRA